ncbi:hypothetical protein GCM10027403_37370 [Arthrobacter tecti]
MGVEVGAYKGARKQAFLMALRLAWRDARKHKGRSALIVALIALPVAGMTMVALLATSSQMTPQERIDADLGTAQAVLVQGIGNGYIQDPTEPRAGIPIGEPDPDFVATSPVDAVPDGYETIVERSAPLELFKGKVPIYAMIHTTELFNSAFASRYELTEGASDGPADAVYLSVALAERMELGVGDSLEVGPDSYPIAGIIRHSDMRYFPDVAFALPGHPLAQDSGEMEAQVFLLGEDPLTWVEVKELNEVGVAALSRHVLLNPPGAAELPPGYSSMQGQGVLMGILAISVIGVLVLAEVGLLAGAAFAVGAKSQRRMLALLAAAGGEKSTVRFVVTASGVVLGAIGAVSGALIGLAVAAVWVHWHLWTYSSAFPGFHLIWWPIAVFAILGFVAAVIAALVPASAVARQNVFSAVRAAHSASKPARRVPLAGLICLALALISGGAGVMLAVTASLGQEMAARSILFVPLMGLGTVLLLVGLLLCTGRIIDLFAKLARRTTASVRMAARDASRNRSRSVPSVAAVLAATAVAAIVMISSATFAHDIEYGQQQPLRDQQGAVPLVEYNNEGEVVGTKDPDAAVEAVEKVMGSSVGPGTVLTGVDERCSSQLEACTQLQLELPAANTCTALIEEGSADPATCRDPYSYGAMMPQFVAGGTEAVEAITGSEPSAETLAALGEGKMAVLNPAWIADGKVTILGISHSLETGEVAEENRYEVEAFAIPNAPNLAIGGIVSPETAEELGFEVTRSVVVMDLPEQPTTSVGDEISAELIETVGASTYFNYNYPGQPTEQILWAISGIAALVALTSAGITAGLALADGRSDHATLAGVGAAPALRKRLAAAQTGFASLLGVGLGLAAGIVPSLAVLTAMQEYQLVIPWPQLLTLVLLVPLIGAGAAWLFTRAKLPMTRRALLQ